MDSAESSSGVEGAAGEPGREGSAARALAKLAAVAERLQDKRGGRPSGVAVRTIPVWKSAGRIAPQRAMLCALREMLCWGEVRERRGGGVAGRRRGLRAALRSTYTSPLTVRPRESSLGSSSGAGG